MRKIQSLLLLLLMAGAVPAAAMSPATAGAEAPLPAAAPTLEYGSVTAAAERL
jgi:hypothetical protein